MDITQFARQSVDEGLACAPAGHLVGSIVSVTREHGVATLPGVPIGAVLKEPDGGRFQVLGSDGPAAVIFPLDGYKKNMVVGQQVTLVSNEVAVGCGRGLLGRVIGGMGDAVDGRGPLNDVAPYRVVRPRPDPLSRPPLSEIMPTGQKVVDALLTIGRGGRMGLFAGPGLGKSMLMSNMARGAQADVSVVCLAGERGREAGELVRDLMAHGTGAKTVVVLATADEPAAMRVLSLYTATAVAQWFQEQGNHVLLLVDSLTRVVRARRELDAALAGAPADGSYGPGTFAFLPPLLERVGTFETGSITGIYTVLEEQRKDDPVAREVRSLTDGHIVLSKRLADRGHWPAVDPVQSVSRVAGRIMSDEHREMAGRLRAVLAGFADNEDMITMGAYQSGSCALTDKYLQHRGAINRFLTQASQERVPFHVAYQALQNLCALL